MNDKLIVNPSYDLCVRNRAEENKPHYENECGKRGAEEYNTVIDQFQVTSNSRYEKGNGLTYCNIFVWDVMSAMRVSLPHWLKNDAPATSTTEGASELTSNATFKWLEQFGSRYGWRKINALDAQKKANGGYPTVAVWYNTSGRSGHIAVVRPETSSCSYSSSEGPVIAQAGSTNYSIANASSGFGSSKVSEILYWTND